MTYLPDLWVQPLALPQAAGVAIRWHADVPFEVIEERDLRKVRAVAPTDAAEDLVRAVALAVRLARPTPATRSPLRRPPTARPRAANVVAYCGSSVASPGTTPSEAANASYDGTVPVTMPRFGVPRRPVPAATPLSSQGAPRGRGIPMPGTGTPSGVPPVRSSASAGSPPGRGGTGPPGTSPTPPGCGRFPRAVPRGLRAQGPDALGVVEFVQGDGGGVRGCRPGCPSRRGPRPAGGVRGGGRRGGGAWRTGVSGPLGQEESAASVNVSCAGSSSSWDSRDSATITHGAGSRGAAARTPSMIARASASWPYSQRFEAFRARTRWGFSRPGAGVRGQQAVVERGRGGRVRRPVPGGPRPGAGAARRPRGTGRPCAQGRSAFGDRGRQACRGAYGTPYCREGVDCRRVAVAIGVDSSAHGLFAVVVFYRASPALVTCTASTYRAPRRREGSRRRGSGRGGGGSPT